jgi:ribosomal protein L40E
VIDVRRDYAGLRIAAGEMYVEMFVQAELDEVLAATDTPRAACEAVVKMMPRRSIAQGYYGWVGYLQWLRAMCDLPGAGIELLADEAQGLLVLAEAERAFRRTHPACWKCGALNEAETSGCRKCGAAFGD